MENIRILAVDDEELVRASLAACFAAFECEYLCLEGPEDIINEAVAFKPDVILLDVMMPQEDGYSVCRRVRSNSDLQGVPIIFLTALANNKTKMEAIAAGADEFLNKPFNLAELKIRISNIVRLNRLRKTAEHRRLFEDLIVSIDNPVLVLNDRGSVEFANTSARSLFGGLRTANDLSACHFDTLLAGEGFRVDALSGQIIKPETSKNIAQFFDVKRLPGPQKGWEILKLTDVTEQSLAARAASMVLSTLSHKLRTPLNVLNMTLDLIDEDSKAGRVSENDFVGYCKRACADLNDLVLKANFFESGWHEYSTGLNCSTASMLKTLENIAIERGTLKVEVSKELRGAAGGVQLSQDDIAMIVTECLRNSIKFHRDHTPDVLIKVYAESKCICVEITDDSGGIDPSRIYLLCKPFVQIEKTHTGQVEGWGLGLFVVWHHVTAIGGSIEIENTANRKGTKLKMLLPLRD